MQDNKKAASGATNTTDSMTKSSIDSVAQQGSEVKQRMMLLYPCDTCRYKDRCTDYHYCDCPAFTSWTKVAWYWTTKLLKAEVQK